MELALCYSCVEDSYLIQIIRNEGEMFKCSVCGKSERKAITVKRLGQIMEPILRKYYELGPQVRKFDNDEESWEQDGDLISSAVRDVLGQNFDFESQIVNAVIDADNFHPSRGGGPYWDDTELYVPKSVKIGHYFAEWRNTLAELKHGRRFFSPSAKALFEKLFDGIDDLQSRKGRRLLPVTHVLPKGTSIYRARVCNSRATLKSMFTNPIREVGPPPAKDTHPPGRMNAEGVVVLYAARDPKTCLAESRSALGSKVAIIEMKMTQALRVLDFTRLDQARTGKGLSYFQPDFSYQAERGAFLQHLHSLISKPIIPGCEADYLITQTMAEYLAHVHDKPFDGILFSSVQRAGGVNIVLFPEKGILTAEPADAFRVKYVDNTFRLVSTTAIRYSHHDLKVTIDNKGDPLVRNDLGPSPDEDWE